MQQSSVTVRKFTQEQRITLVAGCAASGLNIRQYAALNNVSLSALTKWSIKFGISLLCGDISLKVFLHLSV